MGWGGRCGLLIRGGGARRGVVLVLGWTWHFRRIWVCSVCLALSEDRSGGSLGSGVWMEMEKASGVHEGSVPDLHDRRHPRSEMSMIKKIVRTSQAAYKC